MGAPAGRAGLHFRPAPHNPDHTTRCRWEHRRSPWNQGSCSGRLPAGAPTLARSSRPGSLPSLDTTRRGLPSDPGRSFQKSDLPLQPAFLTSQTLQLLPLLLRRAAFLATRRLIRLPQPPPNRSRTRLEFRRHRLHAAPPSDQRNHPFPILRRIPAPDVCHGDLHRAYATMNGPFYQSNFKSRCGVQCRCEHRRSLGPPLFRAASHNPIATAPCRWGTPALPSLPQSQTAMASISTRKPRPGRRSGWMVLRAGRWPLNMRS